MKVDIKSGDSVRVAAETAVDVLGGSLDILINNTGYAEEWIPIAESNPTQWWRSWEVHIKGICLTTRCFLPLLLKSSTKTIINISSVGAHVMNIGASAYQANKFALCRLTEFLDKEYYQQGLIAIVIHPGAVKTELAVRMPPEMHCVLTDTPELPADTMVWLSHERRDWLSGRFMSVNWDMKELEQKKEEIFRGNLLKFRLLI